MGRMSRAKGKTGERELARKLREHGYTEARRGVQYSGATGAADVVGLPGLHIEAKRVERLDLAGAMAQSIADALPGEKPVVIHRKSHAPWLVTVRLDDFMDIYREWEAGLTSQGKPGNTYPTYQTKMENRSLGREG